MDWYEAKLDRVVYVLLDPRNNLPFYVGHTSKRQPSRRLWEHIVTVSHEEIGGNTKGCYINYLLRDGLLPEMRIVKSLCCDYRTICREETKFTRELGNTYFLTNGRVRRPESVPPNGIEHVSRTGLPKIRKMGVHVPLHEFLCDYHFVSEEMPNRYTAEDIEEMGQWL